MKPDFKTLSHEFAELVTVKELLTIMKNGSGFIILVVIIFLISKTKSKRQHETHSISRFIINLKPFSKSPRTKESLDFLYFSWFHIRGSRKFRSIRSHVFTRPSINCKASLESCRTEDTHKGFSHFTYLITQADWKTFNTKQENLNQNRDPLKMN